MSIILLLPVLWTELQNGEELDEPKLSNQTMNKWKGPPLRWATTMQYNHAEEWRKLKTNHQAKGVSNKIYTKQCTEAWGSNPNGSKILNGVIVVTSPDLKEVYEVRIPVQAPIWTPIWKPRNRSMK